MNGDGYVPLRIVLFAAAAVFEPERRLMQISVLGDKRRIRHAAAEVARVFFAPHLVKLTTREYTCYGLFCLWVKNVHAAVVVSGGILCAEGFFYTCRVVSVL